MKFTTNREQIAESLQNAAAVAERRQTIPILSNIRLKAESGRLEVTATDLEIQLKAICEVQNLDEEGETTVSARKMAELCRSLPANENVNFEIKDGKLHVNSKNFNADFATISADDFPEIEITEEVTKLNLMASSLKHVLNKTSFSMASQDVRYYLNGMLIEINSNNLKSVATDGHRLAMASIKNKVNSKNDSKEHSNILPRKAVLELAKLLPLSEDEVTVELGPSFISFVTDSLTFSTKLVDGKYPDYEKVFPTGDARPLKIDKNELQAALTRASVLSNEKYRGVKFELSDSTLKLVANNPEQESAEEEMEVLYSSDSLEVGFNIGYLLDVLGVIESDTVEFVFYGQDASCLIREPESDSEVYVIMPMRL